MFRYLLSFILILALSTNVYSAYFAKKDVKTNNYVLKKCGILKPENKGDYVWEEINSPNDVEIYKEKEIFYNSSDLLLWVQKNIYDLPEIQALTDANNYLLQSHTMRFSDNVDEKGAEVYRNALDSMNLLYIADTVINKAKELGANIKNA